jgi:hypothetical protein
MEVLVSLAIFLMSLVAVGQLVSMAHDRAIEVDARSEAAHLCQSKLNEVICGVTPLDNVNDTPFDEAPDFTYSIEVSAGQAANLSTVTVTVARQFPNGGKYEASLSQMILDPSQFGSTQDVTTIAGTDGSGNPNTSSQDMTGSTGSTGSTGAAGGAAAGAGATKGGATKGGTTGTTGAGTPKTGTTANTGTTGTTSAAPKTGGTTTTPTTTKTGNTTSTTPTTGGSTKGTGTTGSTGNTGTGTKGGGTSGSTKGG